MRLPFPRFPAAVAVAERVFDGYMNTKQNIMIVIDQYH